MNDGQDKNPEDDFYMHVNTTAGAFIMSDTVLTENFDKDYIELITLSERNFLEGELREITPLPYRKELDDLVEEINRQIGTPEFGNGMTVRESWIHGTRDFPSPEQIERAGGHLVIKSYLSPHSFNRARERGMSMKAFTEMRVAQIMDLMKATGGEKVWWFIGDEPFSSHHWKTPSMDERLVTREKALESYKRYVFGGQNWGTYQDIFMGKEDYREQLEDAEWLYFHPFMKRKGLRPLDYNIACGSTAPLDAHYQFEWDFSKMFILEQVFMGGIQTGVAFLRGAGRQYGKYWGLYQEVWDGKHFSNLNYTRYDRNLNRVGGFTPEMLLRARLVAFYSGAHVNFIKHAHATHFAPSGKGKIQVTPVGKDHMKLADFCLRRHPDRGTPVAPIALMLEFCHGWDTAWTERDVIWSKIPFEEGDYMISNFFDEAFPRRTINWNQLPFPVHHPFGTRFSSMSKAHRTEEYRRSLRQGYDHRPYEHRCLTASRWGDCFDIVLDNCSLDVLKGYPVVLFLGRVKLEGEILQRLRSYVESGGRLIVNVRQINDSAKDAEDFLGVRLTPDHGTSRDSHCNLCGSTHEEPEYRYTKVTLSPGAEILAANSSGDVLAAGNRFGAGQVILTTPHYLQAYDGDEELTEGERRFTIMLEIAKDLITHTVDEVMPVKVSGPPVEYLVNRTHEGLIVTLVNNEPVEWRGRVVASGHDGCLKGAVTELWEDVEIPSSLQEGNVVADIAIPPWGFKVASFR